ncbi:MAG: response regulator transcription factor [Verrucomicrobiota bacterium]
MKVLLAEDDPLTREGLAQILQEEGYEVIQAENGEQALHEYRVHRPHVICLDVMMPQLDGYETCRRLRSMDQQVAILFITAKSEEIDAVLGLELGADDFIQKPFGIKEVIARIRAVTRRVYAARPEPEKPKEFTIADLRVVPEELRAYRENTPIELSLRDIQILRLLLNHVGRALPRDKFFDECWGFDYLPNSRTLDQHISQLRKKVERDPKEPAIIQTVHGVGYRYEG